MPARANAQVAIVIPAYQAAARVAGVVAGARSLAPGDVVDDGSTDGAGDGGRGAGGQVRPTGEGFDYETAFLLGACDTGFRVTCVTIPTIYDGATSHFRSWADTWRVARVFARYARRILAA